MLLEKGLDRITGNLGKQWIKNNLDGVVFNKYPGFVMDDGSDSPNLVISRNGILLRDDFMSKGYPTISGGIDGMLIHELGHIWDNRSAFYSTVFGGGYGDALLNFVGGKPDGVRFRDPPINIPQKARFPENNSNTSYGNKTTADYFAHSFAGTVLDAKETPLIANLWIATMINLTTK